MTDYRPRRLGQTLLTVLLLGLLSASLRAAEKTTQLPGHIPAAVSVATLIGPTALNQTVTLAFVLPLQNKAALDSLIVRLADLNDPLYAKYLTPAQFQQQFSPTQEDYDAVTNYAVGSGLVVTHTSPTRTLLNVSGLVSVINAAFAVQLLDYRGPDGRVFHAPNVEPSFPTSIASRITGVIGLSDAAVWLPAHHRLQKPGAFKAAGGQAGPRIAVSQASPATVGSGMFGGLTPKDIETAYCLKVYPPAVAADTTGYGKGQTLGLFELDTYLPTDILLYEQKFGLPMLIPTDELDPTNPVTPTGGEDEVTLDIEMQLALAPLCKTIYVYAGGNLSSLVVQQYQKIADDDLAQSISTSWGGTETGNDAVTLNGESGAFEQMASQGQSIFAAAGDNGAYDGAGTSSTVNMTDATALLVDDPASQPYMTGVGGTDLSVVSPATNEHYLSEQTWGTPDTGSGGGGGGGISQIWGIPSYQQGLVARPGAIPAGYYPVTTAHPDPKTHRNVPDVSFNADPDTGYDIVFGGTDALLVGGTSAAAPIWAGLAALVNEQRAADALPPLGFANPPLYQISQTSRYAHDFHDIADGSTNLYFPAVTGYDNATGLGSFQGLNLVTDLGAPAPLVAATPGDKSAVVTWSKVQAAVRYRLYRSVGGDKTMLALTTSSSYTDTGLTNGTTYSYFVRALYPAGQSFVSEPAQATPAVVQITSGPFGNTKTGAATITWQTNVLANGRTYLGTSPGSLVQVHYNATKSLSHSAAITGLKSGQTYYYKVTSFDGYVTASSAVYSFSEP